MLVFIWFSKRVSLCKYVLVYAICNMLLFSKDFGMYLGSFGYEFPLSNMFSNYLWLFSYRKTKKN